MLKESLKTFIIFINKSEFLRKRNLEAVAYAYSL